MGHIQTKDGPSAAARIKSSVEQELLLGGRENPRQKSEPVLMIRIQGQLVWWDEDSDRKQRGR